MKLSEVLHSISAEKQRGLINIDDWKFTDADYLKSMGFEFDGDYTMSMKSPEIKVYKKKFPQGEFFVVESKDNGIKILPTFDSVIEYFDKYPQPEIDKEKE